MNRLLLLTLLFVPLLVSCVGESDYSSDTGTLSIPWGPKEGNRNPEEAFADEQLLP